MMSYTHIVQDDAERIEEVRVQQGPGKEHREKVVQNIGAERRQNLWQLTSLLWLGAGLLEGLIGMRVLLKLLAANPGAPFAQLVYALSDVFVWPFLGLTVTPAAEGIVLEIPSIIAMIVYVLLFLALDRFIWLVFVRPNTRTISIYERDQN
jgi:hypothetical protein